EDELELDDELEPDDELELPEVVEPPVVLEPPVDDPLGGVGFGAFGLWTRVCARVGPAQRASETAITPHQGVLPSTPITQTRRGCAPHCGAFMLCSLKIT